MIIIGGSNAFAFVYVDYDVSLKSSVATCEVSRTSTSLGDRSFPVAGTRLWNNLLLCLSSSELSELILLESASC